MKEHERTIEDGLLESSDEIFIRAERGIDVVRAPEVVVANIAALYTMPDALLVAAHRAGNGEAIFSTDRKLVEEEVILNRLYHRPGSTVGIQDSSIVDPIDERRRVKPVANETQWTGA